LNVEEERLMLIAALKVLNEQDYIWYTLYSLYHQVDKIVIIECADRWNKMANPKWVTEDGLSVDNTAEIVKNFPDPLGKIKFIQYGLLKEQKTDLELGKIFMQHFEPGDWILWTDADEIYSAKLFERVRTLVQCRRPSPGKIGIYKLNFWGDFKHVIYSDTRGCWHQSHLKFQKVPEGDGVHCAGPDLAMNFFGGKSTGGAVQLWESFYHYSYVRRPQWIAYKMRWLIWNGWERLAGSHDTPHKELDGRKWTKEEWVRHQLPFTLDFDWVNGVFIREYHGPHPEVMMDHPFSQWKWDEKPFPYDESWEF